MTTWRFQFPTFPATADARKSPHGTPRSSISSGRTTRICRKKGTEVGFARGADNQLAFGDVDPHANRRGCGSDPVERFGDVAHSTAQAAVVEEPNLNVQGYVFGSLTGGRSQRQRKPSGPPRSPWCTPVSDAIFFLYIYRPDLAVLRPCLSQGPLRRGFCAPLFFVAP
jgi:hypothetical protein